MKVYQARRGDCGEPASMILHGLRATKHIPIPQRIVAQMRVKILNHYNYNKQHSRSGNTLPSLYCVAFSKNGIRDSRCCPFGMCVADIPSASVIGMPLGDSCRCARSLPIGFVRQAQESSLANEPCPYERAEEKHPRQVLLISKLRRIGIVIQHLQNVSIKLLLRIQNGVVVWNDL